MTLIYRRDKAGPLTIEEVDGNFEDLDRRLQRLETTGIQAEGIARITQNGESLEITGTRGTTFGHFVLPKLIPQPRGPWKASTSYLLMDWVQMGKALYSCVRAHQSISFDEDQRAGYWQVLMEG